MIDWKEISNLGIGIVALIAFFYLVNAFLKHIEAQNNTNNMVHQETTKAINTALQETTKAVNKLANTLDKSSVQDEVFRAEIISLSEDTNKKVTEIHGKVV